MKMGDGGFDINFDQFISQMPNVELRSGLFWFKQIFELVLWVERFFLGKLKILRWRNLILYIL